MTDQPMDMDALEREAPEDPDHAEHDPVPVDEPEISEIVDDYGTEAR